MKHGFITNIEQDTIDNTNFRKVLYSGEHSQLVLMSIPVGGEIGKEVHPDNDQFLRIDQGEGEATINGETTKVEDGFCIIVPAGAEHNVVNTSPDTDLRLYTLYSPPHHKDGKIHVTKEEADADTDDEFDHPTEQ